MFIDPKTEDQARRMLGHIIRQEFDELENQLREIGEETFLRALALYIPVAEHPPGLILSFRVYEHPFSCSRARQLLR